MKKIILMHTAMSLCTAFAVSNTYCQTNAGFAKIEMKTPEITEQKDEVLTPINRGKKHTNNINIKAVRAFTKQFKNAENVSWRITNDGGHVAQFKKDSIETMVRYDAGGSWKYTLRKYAEKRMSTDLRTLVKSTYFDYTISEVTEVMLPNQDNIIYTVLIKTEDSFKILRICDGETEVIGDYTKP